MTTTVNEPAVAIRRVRERIDHAVGVRSITEAERDRFLDILYDDTALDIHDAALAAERAIGAEALDVERLRGLLDRHQRQIDYGYEESECSCGGWNDHGIEEGPSFEDHLIAAARLSPPTDPASNGATIPISGAER